MQIRALPIALILLAALPASAAETIRKTDPALETAALRMRLKNYSGASRAADEAAEGGHRDLLRGVAQLKSNRAEEAAVLLDKAAKTYPLLADYALHYRVQALVKSGKTDEALTVNGLLLKEYPESPLARKSLMQQGDLLFDKGDFKGAETVYQKFIEKFASGSDALQASYRFALCREKLGDLQGAAAMLRTLWLNSPASIQSVRAEEDMKRLAELGHATQPFTPQELMKRGNSLYDQRRYDLALKTFRYIDKGNEKKEFTDRLALRIGQSLLKARRYKDAEQAFRELAAQEPKRDLRTDVEYLLARAMEKQGKDEEAFSAYTKFAEAFPECSEADNALLDAAFVRKFQRKPAETVATLEKLLEKFPSTGLKQRVTWEMGWGNYLAGNYKAAIEQFKKLTASDDYRDRALYWQGRALTASGDAAAAQESFSALLKEYPYGFYALQLPQEKTGETLPKIPGDALSSLPMPDGYERVKALISLGLVEDASRELSAARKKNNRSRGDAAIARLYLETGSYSGAMGLFNGSALKKNGVESKTAWAVLYPLAYGELVTKHAAAAGLSTSLAYAVMRSESTFNPGATSPVGARGLMQLMPETAGKMVKGKNFDPDRLYDPDLNIRLGTRHLKDLIEQYKGNLVAVIASYNAGGHNVNRWLKTYNGLATDEFIESIPFSETRDYVKKVLATAALYKRLYGME